jgi:hypothetical protein
MCDLSPGFSVNSAFCGDRIYGGTNLCELSSFPEWSKDCQTCALETWIAEEPDQKQLWLGSLPIAALKNGDYLATGAEPEADPPVIYLSHDEVSGVIAPSFTRFLRTWEDLCYIGPEIWRLSEYISPSTGYLVANTPQAQTLRRLFKLAE